MTSKNSFQTCSSGSRSVIAQKPSGFTLIELLVVIAIIALLLAIIMPSLAKVKDQVKRVICSNNSRQCGMALHAYTESNDQKIIPTMDAGSGKIGTPGDMPSPFNSYMVYDPSRQNSDGSYIAMHLAVLYDQGYVDIPEIFYCPAQPRTTSYYRIPYYYDYYIGEGNSADYYDPANDMGHYEWGTHIPADTRGSGSAVVRTSFNYWTYGENKLANIKSYKPVIFDNIQEWEVVPHRKGRGPDSDPQGLTVVYADGHSNFCNDHYIFDDTGDLPWNKAQTGDEGSGPGNYEDRFLEVLRRLEGQ